MILMSHFENSRLRHRLLVNLNASFRADYLAGRNSESLIRILEYFANESAVNVANIYLTILELVSALAILSRVMANTTDLSYILALILEEPFPEAGHTFLKIIVFIYLFIA